MSESYSETVLDHFRSPRNLGELDDADGVGVAGDADCGDVMKIWIRVRADRIEEISFKAFGCPAAIACGSMTTVLAKGRSLDEASDIADETVAEALGGLPPAKRHCSNIGAEALANAVWDHVTRAVEQRYNERRARGGEGAGEGGETRS